MEVLFRIKKLQESKKKIIIKYWHVHSLIKCK